MFLGEVFDGRRMARAKCKVSTVKGLATVLFVSTEVPSVNREPRTGTRKVLGNGRTAKKMSWARYVR